MNEKQKKNYDQKIQQIIDQNQDEDYSDKGFSPPPPPKKPNPKPQKKDDKDE